MPPTPDAAALVALLRALPVAIDAATAAVHAVAIDSYPDGCRPSGVVTLTGRDVSGTGEHVAWTMADQEAFAARMPDLVPRGTSTVGAVADALARRTAALYERATLEAAVIDLALRQASTNLFRLAGALPRPVRYVLSFGRCADPVAEARRLATPGVGVKIDVDADWDDAVYAGLAALDAVAVLDFKLTGDARQHARAHAALPGALLEDPALGAAPWSDAVRGRVSFDAPVGSADDIAHLPIRPAAVNVKPARVGGVLEALRIIATCATAGIAVYVGGMFEVDVGRRQLHALAALFSSDGPNDVAPLAGTRPPRIVVDPEAPGFGGLARMSAGPLA